MQKEEVQLKFNFSQPKLIELCYEIHSFAERDIAEMPSRGVTQVYLDDFNTDIVAFSNLKTHEEWEQDQVLATQAKDEAADTDREAIRDIITRAENKWGMKSARYRRYGTKDLSRMSDSDLYVCGKRVIRIAEEDLAELTDEGLLQAEIDDLGTKNEDFMAKIILQAKAIADQDLATEDRYETANALYDKLLKICNSGQNIWHDTDEAKFNDYLIYNTPSGEPPAPLEGPAPKGETVNVKYMTFQPQDIIQATNTGETEWKICIAADATTACANGGLVSAGESKNFYASELGDLDNNKYLNITNPDTENDGSYSVVIVES